MNSRALKILGALAITVAVVAGVWYASRHSGSRLIVAPSASDPISKPSGTAPEAELSQPERAESKPAPTRAAASAPVATVAPWAEQEKSAPPVLFEQVAPNPSEAERPMKMAELEPVLGGKTEFESHYTLATTEERHARMEKLEQVLAGGDPSDPNDRDLYEALKAEWVWLHDNPGKPK